MYNLHEIWNTEQYCICGEQETIEHIYYCFKFNEHKHEIPFEYIYNGTLSKQVKILTGIKNSLEKRTRQRVAEGGHVHHISVLGTMWRLKLMKIIG